ncbi:Phospholipase D precursor [Rickettsiales bacterium Ac37b]|nr:Phospholipase D precursor [Rickettsiales bacterium Ac37b]
MSKRKLAYRSKVRNITFSLIVGIMIGIAACNPLPSFTHNNTISQPIRIPTCFTPPSGCSKVIIETINKATKSIYVQAYGFTDVGIADSLISAYNRGVKVAILLDKSNLYSKYSQMPKVKEAGIDVSIDYVPGIAHNKVMIIDQHTVITGSFNFSKNADLKNAENVIIINDSAVAKQYFQNWLSRKQAGSKTIIKIRDVQ